MFFVRVSHSWDNFSRSRLCLDATMRRVYCLHPRSAVGTTSIGADGGEKSQKTEEEVQGM